MMVCILMMSICVGFNFVFGTSEIKREPQFRTQELKTIKYHSDYKNGVGSIIFISKAEIQDVTNMIGYHVKLI